MESRALKHQKQNISNQIREQVISFMNQSCCMDLDRFRTCAVPHDGWDSGSECLSRRPSWNDLFQELLGQTCRYQVRRMDPSALNGSDS